MLSVPLEKADPLDSRLSALRWQIGIWVKESVEIIELALKKKKSKKRKQRKKDKRTLDKFPQQNLFKSTALPRPGAVCAFRREHRVCPQPGTETWRSRDRDTVFLVDQTALVFLDIFTKDEDPLPSRRASSRKTANSSSDAEAEGNGKRSRGRLEPPLPPLPPGASLDQGELEAAALPSAPAWGCTEHGPCAQPCGSAVTPAQTTEVPPHPVATGHSVCWQRAERTHRV